MLTFVPDLIRNKEPSILNLSKIINRDWESENFSAFLDEVIKDCGESEEYTKILKKLQTSNSNLRALFKLSVEFNKNSNYHENYTRRYKTAHIYSGILSEYTSHFFNLDWSELDTVNQAMPLFYLPNLNRAARQAIPNLSLYYNQDYTILDTLTLEDFRKIHFSKQGTDDNFKQLINELAEQNKINPLYTKLDESDEYFTNYLESAKITFQRSFSSTTSVQTVRNYIKTRLEALKFIASTVIHFKTQALKSFLVLKLDDNFADFTDDEHPSYTKLIYDNSSLDKNTQFFLYNSFTFSKFVNNGYVPLDSSESKIKLLRQQYFSKAKEAKVIKEVDGLKVYSIFPKEWLESFSSLNIVNKKMNFQKQLPTSFSFTKINEINSPFSVGPFDDISFVGDFYLHLCESPVTTVKNILAPTDTFAWNLPTALNSSIYANKEVINLSELCSNAITFTNGKTNALVLNNFCTGLQPFTFEIKQVTKTQLLNSNNMFVPIAFKTTRIVSDNLRNTNALEEDIYYVCLVNFSSYVNVFRKFTKAQKFIQYFNNLLCTENSVGLFDPRIYEEEINRKFGKITKYYKNQKDKFEKIGNDFVEIFAQQNPFSDSLIDSSKLSFLNGKLNIDRSIIDNLERLKTTKKKIADKLEEESEAYQNILEEENSSKLEIQNLTDQIESLKRLILSSTEQIENILNNKLKNLPELIKQQENRFKKQKELNDSFLLTFQKAVSDYEQEEQKALESKNFIPDSFFDGLSSKGLFLIELVMKDSGHDKYFFRGNNINKLTQDTYSKLNIVSLEFLIAKPFEIKVDGSQDHIIYAGPLKVKVSNESIQVAPVNSSSIFAFVSEDTATVHPHSSSFRVHKSMNIDELWNYKRGCLGEASPYIFNSFKDNSLKMIIVNSLVWLTSANSADAWGKHHKHFPKKNDMNLENLDSFAIEIDSLINFIKDSENSIEDEELIIELAHQQDDEDECQHEEHYEDGTCMECGVYHEWAENYDEEDDDYERENHDQVTTNTTQNVYVPYVQLTNNNQG